MLWHELEWFLATKKTDTHHIAAVKYNRQNRTREDHVKEREGVDVFVRSGCGSCFPYAKICGGGVRMRAAVGYLETTSLRKRRNRGFVSSENAV